MRRTCAVVAMGGSVSSHHLEGRRSIRTQRPSSSSTPKTSNNNNTAHTPSTPSTTSSDPPKKFEKISFSTPKMPTHDTPPPPTPSPAKRWVPSVGQDTPADKAAIASLRERILGSRRIAQQQSTNKSHSDHHHKGVEKGPGGGVEEVVEVVFSSEDPLTEATQRLQKLQRKITSLTHKQSKAIYKCARPIAEIDAIWSLKHGDFYRGRLERERAKQMQKIKDSNVVDDGGQDERGEEGGEDGSRSTGLLDVDAIMRAHKSLIPQEEKEMRDAMLAKARTSARSSEINRYEVERAECLKRLGDEVLPIATVLCGRAITDLVAKQGGASAQSEADKDTTDNLFDLLNEDDGNDQSTTTTTAPPGDVDEGVVSTPTIPLPTIEAIASILRASLQVGFTTGPAGADALSPVMKCLKQLMRQREPSLTMTRVTPEDSSSSHGARPAGRKNDHRLSVDAERRKGGGRDAASGSERSANFKGNVVMGDDDEGAGSSTAHHTKNRDHQSPFSNQQRTSDGKPHYVFKNHDVLFPISVVVDILYACAFQNVMEQGMLQQLLDWDLRLQRKRLSNNDILRAVIALGRFGNFETPTMRGMLKELGSTLQSFGGGQRKGINDYKHYNDDPLSKFAVSVSPANLFWTLATISRCPTRDPRLIHGLVDAIILKVRFQEYTLRKKCGGVPAVGIAQRALDDVLDANDLPSLGTVSSPTACLRHIPGKSSTTVVAPVESSWGLSLLFDAGHMLPEGGEGGDAASTPTTVFTQGSNDSPITHLITGRQLQQVQELLGIIEMPYPPLYHTFMQVVGQREGGVMLDHEGSDPEDARNLGFYTVDKDAAREAINAQNDPRAQRRH